MVLEVTAKDPEGKRIFHTSRAYHPQATDARSTETALGPENKLGLIRDTGIQPFTPKEETIEVPLAKGLREAVIEVDLSYRPRPGNIYPIHHVKRRVGLDPNR